MHDLVVCRTAQLGGHTARCSNCGFERYAYNSCRNRHCPTCQTWTKVQWVEARKAEVLPVPSFHVVFPLPHALTPLILANQRRLFMLLLRAASQTRAQCGQRNRGGQIGGTMVLHTWDQTWGAHCHVPCLIAAGARAADGARWIAAKPRFLFPVRAWSTVLRGTCLDALAQGGPRQARSCAEAPPDRATTQDSTPLLEQL
jgi:hypothetical protein